ncbi:helix-turn-helix domain-containing protein [Dyadobacter sp. NIV53]|nr:helix-turn-helix domain-containing protein [Dyadobacter sp. NIV53]
MSIISLKTGKANAICKVLDCQPADIPEYVEELVTTEG